MIVAPACADITDAVRQQLRQADLLFFDGTLFTDDEMIVAGLGQKTGRRAWDMCRSVARTERWRGLPTCRARRVLLHINNTNPILLLRLAGAPAGRGGRLRSRL